MKALYFSAHGSSIQEGIKNLKYGEMPEPRIGTGEVLIKVRACAINHLDLWVLEGWPGLKLQFPHIGGADISGEVHEVDKSVFGWKRGDRVVVNPGYAVHEDEWTKKGEESVSPHYRIFGEGRHGGFADYVSAPATSLMSIPSSVSYTDAAAPLLVGLTAWRMLNVRAELKVGETVLIVGAGGGLNSFSIQLARYLGARVIALTSSEEKAKRASALGATEVVDYTRYPDWSRKVREITSGRGVDVVVDNVGAKTFDQSLKAVCRGGRIVTVGNTSGPLVSFDNRLVFGKQISIIGSTMGSSDDFRDVMHLIFQGKLKPVIDSLIPLEQGREAYERLLRGEQFGKIVLTAG